MHLIQLIGLLVEAPRVEMGVSDETSKMRAVGGPPGTGLGTAEVERALLLEQLHACPCASTCDGESLG